METKIKEYQDIIKKYIEKLEKEIQNKKDPLLLQLFKDTKKLIVKNPNIPEKYLDFYTDWLKNEYNYLEKNNTDLENSTRILMSISEKIQRLSNSETKKDGITYVTLDESILDIDSWLPKEAIQDVVNAIKMATKKEYPKSYRRVKKSKKNQRRKNHVCIHTKIRHQQQIKTTTKSTF